MSDHDRGAYTPQTDAPLAFDPRERRGGGPAPMTLLVSAILLMALIVGLLLFYRHGVRHAGQAPQLVGAPVGPTKAPPPADAEAADQSSGLQIYKSEATPPSETKSTPAFEAAPEQPAPLPAERPAAPPPAVLTASPAPLRGPAPVAAPTRRVVVAQAPPLAAEPAPTPVAPIPPKPVAAHPHAAVAALDEGVAGSAFATHAAAPAHAAQARPAETREAALDSAVKPARPAKPRLPVPADEQAAETTHEASAPATGGAGVVQIGAFASTALAQQGWSDTQRVMPGQMAGKSRRVETTMKDGKTYYRTFVVGFASRDAAHSFCSSLKAKGKDCIVR
jgi:hypothetical protein